MGNRAVISFSKDKNATGIYLHWNGGVESVLAFCHAAKKIGARSPDGDGSYAMAGLIRAVTLFIHYSPGELLSVGVGPVSTLDTDNFDNGHFIVGDDWEIEERLFTTDSMRTVEEFEDWQVEQYKGIQADILARHLMICEQAAKEAA